MDMHRQLYIIDTRSLNLSMQASLQFIFVVAIPSCLSCGLLKV